MKKCENESHFTNISHSTALEVFTQGMTEGRKLPKLLLG